MENEITDIIHTVPVQNVRGKLIDVGPPKFWDIPVQTLIVTWVCAVLSVEHDNSTVMAGLPAVKLCQVHLYKTETLWCISILSREANMARLGRVLKNIYLALSLARSAHWMYCMHVHMHSYTSATLLQAKRQRIPEASCHMPQSQRVHFGWLSDRVSSQVHTSIREVACVPQVDTSQQGWGSITVSRWKLDVYSIFAGSNPSVWILENETLACTPSCCQSPLVVK